MSYLFNGSTDISEIRDFIGVSDTTVISDTEIQNAINYAEAEVFDSLGYTMYSTNTPRL